VPEPVPVPKNAARPPNGAQRNARELPRGDPQNPPSNHPDGRAGTGTGTLIEGARLFVLEGVAEALAQVGEGDCAVGVGLQAFGHGVQQLQKLAAELAA
jgi:hypothetical protein